MRTRYRLLSIAVLVALLVAWIGPVTALAHGPMGGGRAVMPTQRGGNPGPGPGPGHGGHHGGWGRYGMLGAFAQALGMRPWGLIRELQAGRTIAELAQERRVAVEALVDEVVAEMTAWMEHCLQFGHMTEAQFTWMHEHIAAHAGWLVDNSQALLYEWHHGPVFGMGWGYGYGGLVWAAAEVLELSPWEIHEALHEGATIAELAQQVAERRGNVTPEELIDAIVETFMAPRIAALNAAVDAGWLTPEQAEWLRSEMEEHARWLIENTPPMGEFGHGYGGGCH